jgi:hypothetical protein
MLLAVATSKRSGHFCVWDEFPSGRNIVGVVSKRAGWFKAFNAA